MKRGFLALLTVSLALIVAFVACSGSVRSERSGCSACSLGCVACTACAAYGCARSCANGMSGTQNLTDFVQSFDGN